MKTIIKALSGIKDKERGRRMRVILNSYKNNKMSFYRAKLKLDSLYCQTTGRVFFFLGAGAGALVYMIIQLIISGI